MNLKPCPFCGSTIIEGYSYHDDSIRVDGKTAIVSVVKCQTCEVQTRKYVGMTFKESRLKAFNAWNMRTEN